MRNELYDLANQINNMFYKEAGYKSFPIDVVEGENKYVVFAELPGIKKENIQITFEDSCLTIKAKPNKKEENKKYLIHERTNQYLERSIYFNDIEEESINAKYEDGILMVTINTKKPEEKVKKEIVIE